MDDFQVVSPLVFRGVSLFLFWLASFEGASGWNLFGWTLNIATPDVTNVKQKSQLSLLVRFSDNKNYAKTSLDLPIFNYLFWLLTHLGGFSCLFQEFPHRNFWFSHLSWFWTLGDSSGSSTSNKKNEKTKNNTHLRLDSRFGNQQRWASVYWLRAVVACQLRQ